MLLCCKYIVFSIFSFYSVWVFATTFNPMTIEKQVEEASGGAIVEMVSSQSYKKDNGHIYTEYSFKVSEKFNLSENDLNEGLLKLDMLGGKFEGVTSSIDGAPVFEKGKKTFILLKKINAQMYLSNFTMGKYEIQKIQGKDFFISDVFPMNPQMGRISREKMLDLMRKKWHLNEKEKVKNILSIPSDSTVNNTKINENKIKYNRQPASEKDESPINFRLIIMFLALAGIIFSLIKLKDKK